MLYKLIFDRAKNDWKKKITASGIIVALVVTGVVIKTRPNDFNWLTLPIYSVFSYIGGCLVAVYLLIGSLLNHLIANKVPGFNKAVLYFTAAIYALSLIPLLAGVLYLVYLGIMHG